MSDMRNYTPLYDFLEKRAREDAALSRAGGKEGEPMGVQVESLKEPEVVENEAEPKQELERPVEEYLQDANPQIELDPQLKKAGLQVIDDATLSPFQRIKLPLSDEQVMEGRHKSVMTSWRWLAEFAYFMLLQGHITLKKIHGKVIRVLKR